LIHNTKIKKTAHYNTIPETKYLRTRGTHAYSEHNNKYKKD
jgi:hypothetical protein